MSTTLSELARDIAPVHAAADDEATGMTATQIWDLPLRVFHWSLTLAVSAAFATAWLGGAWMQWHVRLGAVTLALLLFRLAWGLIGSVHARFASFLPTPSSVIAYLRGKWQGIGHTPLGAVSVVLLLLILGAQLGTGLFANDDIAFQGPLAGAVDKALSDSLRGWHAVTSNVLLAWIAAHTLAIGIYAARRINLVGPMLTGKKHLPRNRVSHPVSVSVRRLIVAAAIACGSVWVVFAGWLVPRAVPPPPIAAQDW